MFEYQAGVFMICLTELTGTTYLMDLIFIYIIIKTFHSARHCRSLQQNTSLMLSVSVFPEDPPL